VTTPRTPNHAIDASPRPESDPDLTLERGFVASLRWLVSEGDARGVRRIAVELRALREALAALDETRAARDDFEKRAQELDKELQAALAVLGPGTAINGNGSLVQRLARLRERLAEDTASRRQLTIERDAWRAMCTLLTQTRARVHELLEDAERERDSLTSALDVMKARVMELSALHDDAARDSAASRAELAAVREKLRRWSGTVERALHELAGAAGSLARDA
jgi:chromosome segregation ATPase